MSRIEATDEAWRAAVRLVRAQMGQNLQYSNIEKRGGPAENTVRSMLLENKVRNESSWLSLSQSLDLGDRLVSIIKGNVDVSVVESPLERRMAELLAEMAKIDALQAAVAELNDVVRIIDQKIDLILEGERPSED